MEPTGILGATRQTWRHGKTVRDIFSEVMEANPGAGAGTLFREYLDRLRNDDECLTAAARYAFDNSYRSWEVQRAREAQQKPSTVAQRVAAAKLKVQQAEAYAQTVKSIKQQVMLLNLPMPNGKLMRNCTGAEVASFGKAYEKIARKVGPTKRVGEVLSEEQLHSLLD